MWLGLTVESGGAQLAGHDSRTLLLQVRLIVTCAAAAAAARVDSVCIFKCLLTSLRLRMSDKAVMALATAGAMHSIPLLHVPHIINRFKNCLS